jgi:hypothetical protein
MFFHLVMASALSLALVGEARADAIPATKTPAPTSVSVDVKVGDRWDYAYHSNLDNGSSGTTSYVVLDVSAGKIEAESRTHRSNGGRDAVRDFVYDRSWRMIEAPAGKYLEADAVSEPFPSVAVGKEWTSNLLWQPTNSSLGLKWTEHRRVAAWESVTLENGQTYEAFRISVRLESTPLEGTGIQVVTAGFTTQKLVDRIVEWYAPAANRYVKRTFESSRDGTVVESFREELTNYSHGS